MEASVLTTIEKAITFAAKAHAGTTRKGKERPYILHPVEVMTIVLGLDRSDYPYHEALDMIEGEYFWIIAWDD